VPLLLRVDYLLRKTVYRAVAQKRPWYICPSRRRCIARLYTLRHVILLKAILCCRTTRLSFDLHMDSNFTATAVS
jgi:hypothetical protein